MNTGRAIKGTAIGGGIAALIITSVLHIEGGYSNDPSDPGGETNHGITAEVARNHDYKGEMVDLTKDLATQIYVKDYIEKPNYHLVITRSPAVAHKLVDAGVNVGPYRSSCWFQKSLNSLNRGGTDYANLVVDCRVGPATIKAYEALEKKRGSVKACEMVIKLIDAQQAQHYMSLTNLSQYTIGWVDHRINNVPLSYCTSYGK